MPPFHQLPLVVAAVALAACSTTTTDDHVGHDPAGRPPADAQVVAVTAGSFSFEPKSLTVSADQDLALELTATDTTHDVVIDAIGFHVAADPGQTAHAWLRFERPGRYVAYCSIPGHREAGMETTVTVV